MHLSSPVLDVYLKPGEFRFGDARLRLHTVLGSCVAITLWHPERHIGGMCHYVLPERRHGKTEHLDGHYADDAMALFLREIRGHRTRPDEYELKLFGGGSMFDHEPADALDVALRNVEYSRKLAARHGFQVVAEHLGGIGHRNIIFEIGSGDVWVRHVSKPR